MYLEVSVQDYFWSSSVSEVEKLKVQDVNEVRSGFCNGDLNPPPKTFCQSRRGFRPNYFDQDKFYPISSENWAYWFQKWLEILQPNIPPAQNYELSLRLTGDGEIQILNHQYRYQNQPTDVLAFAALEVNVPIPEVIDSDLQLYLGDIVISVETALRQARQREHSLTTELAWLAAHGFLHLLGWDHLDEQSWQQMLKQQLFLLHTVGITIEKQITPEN
ncbi:MAG: rRNA maturation RNase YbeY [Okeania sp. SIO2C9]|uniref:rRNA maturation RNase YbeY n=1 Tax=Okeania sp. SIO2C9 TaxID=2607791 RepID=UPI0013C1D022|nr:rRNA maturation RNase YbeY [Okeania sp. SIO2C9]NEQ75075.1 rRNA maturation RNase YbeY [Okeania sp. SIO2C9]